MGSLDLTWLPLNGLIDLLLTTPTPTTTTTTTTTITTTTTTTAAAASATGDAQEECGPREET